MNVSMAGTTEPVTAQGDAVATLVGVTALEWYGMEATAKEARLNALKGARLLVSLFMDLDGLDPDCPSDDPWKVAFLRCLNYFCCQ